MAKNIIAIFMLLVLLTVVTFTAYQYNRDPVVILTKKSLIAHIEKDSTYIPHFLGMIVLRADIQTNTSQLSHMFMVDTELNRLYTDYFSTKIISDKRPLFIKHNDNLNSRMVRLINHEFVCEDYENTDGYLFAPTARVATVCSSAFPVSSIEFNGYVSVFLRKSPTEAELSIIEMIVRDIAEDVAPVIGGN